MAETLTNRGAYLALKALSDNNDLRLGVFTGTQTGVQSRTLNTVADLDAIASVNIHTERKTLAEAVTEDDTNNRAGLSNASVSFAAAAGVSAMGVFLYNENSGTDATRDLIAVYTTNFSASGVPMDGGLNINITDLIRAS